MTPHHKPKNVTLTKIGRLSRGNMSHIHHVGEIVAHVGEHRAFEVAARALERLRGDAPAPFVPFAELVAL